MNVRLLLFICFFLVGSGSGEFLHSVSTPEAGNVEVTSEHNDDLVNFTVTFELVKSPLWIAVGLNTQAKMK
ncbi:hypothetical protein BpHYR1_005787 [Brachionus plicatilis]|uniref:Uncharacterized protein n=1 Tax=Brachionus plicatilis TaxID=10195 RepID=A0A3M7QE87_BRAPC|nr:hypothetical protein BpHYR1_005787 [Brachionus plicatilis]